jgi:hypothetical protein
VDNKILIGLLTQEYARRADFYDYFNLLEKPANATVIYSHDRSPASGRNRIIEAAIEYNFSHILFMDDDMAPKKNALSQLLEHDVDIVSSLYLNRAYPHIPLAFDIADESGAAFPVYLTPNMPRLIPIVAAGLGFVLIKTDVFKRMEKPWVRLGELNPEHWCDDMGFFHRARKEATNDIWLDTECRVGHMGTMLIYPNYEADGKWYSGYDTQGKGCVNIAMELPETVEKA